MNRERLDRILQEETDSGFAAGISALVIQQGKEIYSYAYGMADIAQGRKMERDTIISLYSMTKPVTAAAVMILVERGILHMEDPVSKYLPEFSHPVVFCENGTTIPAEREIRIADLLNMTSGIPYPEEWHEPGRRMGKIFAELIAKREQGERVDTQEYMRRIASVPLCFQPGKQWMYGLSADVLGGIIEKATGLTYDEYLKKELFIPLDMPDTGFFVPEEKADRFAVRYEWQEKEQKLVPFTRSHLGEYYGEDVAFLSGGAGLVSTLDDYSHFAMMLANGGEYRGVRILKPETVAWMAGDHLSEEQKASFNWDSTRGYGYGCLMRTLLDQKQADTLASVGEYGWDGWTGNYVSIDPKEKLVILYFIQRCGAGTTPGVQTFKNALYQELSENHPVISKEQAVPLFESKFIKVFDLQYAPGKHYYNATRRGKDDLMAVKTAAEFQNALPDAVSCIVVLATEGAEPRLLLSQEFRYPAGQFLLSVPAGLIDKADQDLGNPILAAAKREIQEETGIEVTAEDDLFIVNPLLFSTPGMTDESNALVCAKIRRADLSMLSQDGAEGSECFDGFTLVTKNEAAQILKSGRDFRGNFYSVYTWMALAYFVGNEWE